MKIHTFINAVNGSAKGGVELRDDDATVIHADRVDLTSATSRARFAKAAAGGSAQKQAQVESLLIGELNRLRKSPPTEGRADDGYNVDELLAKTPQDVIAEAEAMLSDPRLLTCIANDAAALGVAGEKKLVASLYLAGTSRLLQKPVAVEVQGHTSSGKSYIIETVATMFPPESVLLAQQMTPQALFHMRPGSLRHRFIVAGERSRREDDDTAEATRALREMISSGKLSKLIPEKDEGGRIVTKLIEQDGPIAYVESTTLTKIFGEDLNRFILLATDEQEAQTRKILQSIADHRSAPCRDTQAILDRHHALQRIIDRNRTPVTVPFAKSLAVKFPANRPEARRAFGHVLSMVEACTLLSFRQRERDDTGAIVAEEADYRVARWLLAGPMARTLGGAISDGAIRFHDRLAVWAADRFTSSDAYQRESASDTAVRGWIRELCDAGVVTLLEAKRGMPSVYSLMDKDPISPSEASTLPTVEEVFGGLRGSLVRTEANPMDDSDLTPKCAEVRTTSDASG